MLDHHHIPQEALHYGLYLSLLQRMGVAVDRFGNSSTPMHELDG